MVGEREVEGVGQGGEGEGWEGGEGSKRRGREMESWIKRRKTQEQ